MASPGLTLFVDLVSQPSRAVVIFCRANGIPFTMRITRIGRGEHKKEEFKAKFPLCKLPAMDDSGFLLSESHAIMRYLVATRPCNEHWYPGAPQARARVDMLLDWHHTNLRRGAATLLFQEWLAPMRGLPSSRDIAADAETLLKTSLATIEGVWLKDTWRRPRFLLGNPKPSLADLSMACEVVQLQILGSSKYKQLLADAPRVQEWLNDVSWHLDPFFSESLKVLNSVVDARAKRGPEEQSTSLNSSGWPRQEMDPAGLASVTPPSANGSAGPSCPSLGEHGIQASSAAPRPEAIGRGAEFSEGEEMMALYSPGAAHAPKLPPEGNVGPAKSMESFESGGNSYREGMDMGKLYSPRAVAGPDQVRPRM